MIYYVGINENNYISIFGETKTEECNIELDFNTIESQYIMCYQIIDGKAILDKNMKKEQMVVEKNYVKAEQIAKLKKELADTDYEAIKYSEGWFTEDEYAPIKAMREDLREQIRALEN